MVLGSSYQLCPGQKSSIEYAIQMPRKQYEKTDSDAKLLIDAENAFNSLNRKLALKKKHSKYMPFYTTRYTNSYSNPSKLFVNKNVILPREGTTQGDP